MVELVCTVAQQRARFPLLQKKRRKKKEMKANLMRSEKKTSSTNTLSIISHVLDESE